MTIDVSAKLADLVIEDGRRARILEGLGLNDLHEHIHKENNILFPSALQLEGTTSDD